MNLIKLCNRMDTIFMSSEDSTTSDPHRLLLSLSNKMNLKRSDKYVDLSNLRVHYTWKNIKMFHKNKKKINKYLGHRGNYVFGLIFEKRVAII